MKKNNKKSYKKENKKGFKRSLKASMNDVALTNEKIERKLSQSVVGLSKINSLKESNDPLDNMIADMLSASKQKY